MFHASSGPLIVVKFLIISSVCWRQTMYFSNAAKIVWFFFLFHLLILELLVVSILFCIHWMSSYSTRIQEQSLHCHLIFNYIICHLRIFYVDWLRYFFHTHIVFRSPGSQFCISLLPPLSANLCTLFSVWWLISAVGFSVGRLMCNFLWHVMMVGVSVTTALEVGCMYSARNLRHWDRFFSSF